MKKFILLIILLMSSNLFAWSEPLTTSSPIKAFHVDEIRNVINLKRQCYGVPDATWTDPSLTPGTTKIKSVHLAELRSAINSLWASCNAGLCSGGSGSYSIRTGSCAFSGSCGSTPSPSWTTNIAPGSGITPAPLNELRTVLDSITCTPYTYNWLAYGWGACYGGSGYWSYDSWGGCTGGYGNWNYGGWGGCSVACGDGVQYRGYSCVPQTDSGVQYRGAYCNYSAGSGTQDRSVVCQRSDSTIVADSYCTGAKPATTQSCAPTDSSVCGPQGPTSQACTPASTGCAGSPADSQACNNGPCCTPANNSTNMCPGNTFVTAASTAQLFIDPNPVCNTPAASGLCHNGSANISFITPCSSCPYQFVICQCN